MTVLGQFRRSQRLIRSVFAVFVLALLQTTWVPCALAGAVAAQAISMPVASAEADRAATSVQDAAMADMPDCVYCPPQHEQTSAADSTSYDCLYPHESRVDSGKAQQLQLEQLVFHPTFISASVFSFLLEPNNRSPSLRPQAPSPQRPFTLTYCVQLK